jgi:hypothetical protein
VARDQGYALDRAVKSQWKRLIDPGLSVADFAADAIAQIKYPGSEEAPPFLVAAFEDETEADCWGTHSVESWEDARTIASEFLLKGGFVVVTDCHEQSLSPAL